MKKDKVLYMGIALLMAGCSSDKIFQDSSLIPINLGYTVLQAEMTRAATDLNEGHLQANDKVTVKVSKTGESSYDTYSFLTVDNTGKMVPASSPIPNYPEDNSNVDIVAYYPSTAGTSFSVKADQTSDDNYRASDLMFASVTNQAPTSTTVALPFAHQMAKIIINATPADGGITIGGITLKNIKPTVTFSQTAEVDYSSSPATGSADITMSNNGAALIPQQTISGTFLVISTSAGDATYALSGKEFLAGHQYTLNITVNSAALGVISTITNWNDDDAVTITGTAWNIVVNGTYTYTGNAVEPEAENIIVTDARTGNTIDESNYGIGYSNNINAGTAAIIAYGKGIYTGLLAIGTFTIDKAAASISFSKSSANIPQGVGTYTNTLTNTGDGVLTYTSSSSSIASIDISIGTATLNAIGTTTITATVTDGENFTYDTPTISYTLTVNNNTLSTLKSNLNQNFIGYCVSDDGYLFPSAEECRDARKTGVGLVAYIGTNADASNSGYKILVLSLTAQRALWSNRLSATCTSEPVTNVSTAITKMNGISNTSTLTSHHGTKTHGHYAAYSSSNYGVSRPSGASGWFLPSLGQWNEMVKSLVKKAGGTASNMTETSNNNMLGSVFESVIINAGGTPLTARQWSSTEYSAENAWHYSADEGRVSTWTSSGGGNKADNCAYRPIFAY